MKIIIVIATVFFSTNVLSLEIDEKLTTRIMEVSATKKTILLNRGLEDGLMVGEHAKLFLTDGMIARAVVVKASPSRSIWSIYRLISPDRIVADKVVNIKMTSPLNITDDPSRPLHPIPVHPNVNALDQMAHAEREDFRSLDFAATLGHDGIPKDRTFEAWGMIHLNNFSGNTSKNRQSTLSGLNLSLGIEKYFKSKKKSALDRLSLSLFYHHASNMTASINGDSTGNVAHEFGVGASWHFLSPPLSYHRPIPFVQGTYGVGMVEDIVRNYDSEEIVWEGIDNFFSIGAGLKYFAVKGWGMRILGDFYYRNEHYTIENSNQKESKQLRGMRFMLGLAWRFQ